MIKLYIKKLIIMSFIYSVAFHTTSLIGQGLSSYHNQELKKFGFSVYETCTTDKQNGHCWLLSMRFALKNSQKHRMMNTHSDSKETANKFHFPESESVITSDTEDEAGPISTFSNANEVSHFLLNQYSDSEEASAQWAQAHQFNSVLAQDLGITILTIEINDEGLIHITQVEPVNNSYEYQIIFYGSAQNLLSHDQVILETLHNYIQTSNVSLFLTPSHVQPIIPLPHEYNLDTSEVLTALQTLDSSIRTLSLVDLISSGSLLPDFNSLYGAKTQVVTNKGIVEYREKCSKDFKLHKEAEHRGIITHKKAKRLLRVVMVTISITVTATYYYWEEINRVTKDSREHYYQKTLLILRKLLKLYLYVIEQSLLHFVLAYGYLVELISRL